MPMPALVSCACLLYMMSESRSFFIIMLLPKPPVAMTTAFTFAR